MIIDIAIFEIFLIWSYFFVVIRKIFSLTSGLAFSLFVSNVSFFTFIGTIIMGLMKFDLMFVVLSVSVVMISMHLLFDQVKRRYDILTRKNKQFDKVKTILDYSLIALIIFKIIY